MNKTVLVSAAVAVCLWANVGLAQKHKPPAKKPPPQKPAPAVHPPVQSETAEPAPEPTTEEAAPEPTKNANRDTGVSPKKKRQKLDASNAMVMAVIGPELGMRNFAYNDALLGGLRSYTNNAVPMGSVDAALYPFAHSGTPILVDVGLVAGVGDSLEFESKTTDGTQTAKGNWLRYSVGARGRIHTSGKPGEVLVGVQGTYGASKFAFTGTDPIVSQVPSVDYKYLRAGADVRIPFGAFSVTAAAGYDFILSSGPFEQKFPRAEIGGVDALLGAAYRVAENVEIAGSAHYERVFSKLNPQPGDQYVAGGALDQYLIFQLGVSLLF